MAYFADQSRRWAGWFAAATLSGAIGLALPAASAAQVRTDSEAVHQEELSAQSAAKHHYNSPAERAEDDLLIVKVKAAIADADLADNSPMTVDADHGRVTLTGVLESREDVQRTVSLVQG